VSAADPMGVMQALRGALDRSGPAILPIAVQLPAVAGASGLASASRTPVASASDLSSASDLWSASAVHAGGQTRSATVPGAAGQDVPDTVPQSTALVIETSGSTGIPKRVMLSADAVLASVAASETALGGPGQWLLALPTHYVAGVQVLARSIAAGTTPEVLPPGPFDARAFAIATSRLDGDLRFTSLVPDQLLTLVDAAADSRRVRRALQSYDAILIGGQRLDAALAERAHRLGARVVRTYGSSETAGGCVYDGVPLPGARARVVDGQIELAGPMLADGYLGDPERTDAAFHLAPDADGIMHRWYRTGDTGTVEAGRISVTGRIDNVIISGGTNVSLDRVEEAVRALTGFGTAIVVGVDDERWGQVPVVAVFADGARGADARAGSGSARAEAGAEAESEAGTEAQAEAEAASDARATVRAHVAALIGVAAQPAAVVTLGEMPTLSSGKPDRRRIRSLVDEALGRVRRGHDAAPATQPDEPR
jgi:O-succinylbenzoic acid--CoA ligase